jgi:hypothetical protein
MVKGYRPPQPILQRLWGKSVAYGKCWRWEGSHCREGYGRIITGSRTDGSRRLRGVHQVAYEHFIGPIPEGYEIDHVWERGCRYRDCWNPEHLEAVTHRQNMRRLTPAGLKTKQDVMREIQKRRWAS